MQPQRTDKIGGDRLALFADAVAEFVNADAPARAPVRMLFSGPVTLPGNVEATMPGLRKRLADEGLTDLVEVVGSDLLKTSGTLEPADCVWTSCSWHYSVNHRRPVADFIYAMRRLCRPRGGVLGAEYMMPVEPRHFAIEHYLPEVVRGSSFRTGVSTGRLIRRLLSRRHTLNSSSSMCTAWA